jgi:hypothetical protein
VISLPVIERELRVDARKPFTYYKTNGVTTQQSTIDILVLSRFSTQSSFSLDLSGFGRWSLRDQALALRILPKSAAQTKIFSPTNYNCDSSI